ncbi:hypothetical protein HZB02_02965, partial [Candidatus Woesearchaeota archaeon]|nr:hypothetical protein [Candidatus Woesearchaeota archaeon]
LIINNLFNVTAGTGVVRTAGTYYINGSEVCTSANGQCVAASCAATGRCGNLTYQNWNNTNAATAQINLTLNTTSFHVSGGNRRVGIGTKNPAVALDITADTRNGTAVVLANGGDQGVFYGAYDAIGTINSLMGIDGGDTFRMFGVVRMIFTVNGSEAMTIEDGKVGFFTDNGVTSNFALNGNISLNNSLYTAVVGSRTGVGIGTPSPVALLHVNGSMVAGDANFTNLNASSAFTLKGNLDINDLFNVTASSGRTLAEGELSIGSTLNTSTQNTTLTSQPGSVIFILGP